MITQEQYIQKCKTIHGDKYDYSKTIYINSKSKIIVTCLIHGDFSVIPNNHLSHKQGCPKCSIIQYGRHIPLTQDEFIDKCKEIYGDKYDYTKTIYTKTRNKVIITCPIHGDFNIKANNYLCGKKGCPKCSTEKSNREKMLTQDEFIYKCNLSNNNKYNYGKTIYTGRNNEITVTCLEHGDFLVKANVHLKGNSGCPKCGLIKRRLKTGLSNANFLERCKLVHGEKYDYSLTIYTTSKHKVTIICKEHGVFNQNPMNHLLGGGCPKCGDKIRSINRTKSNENYIKEAIKAHNGKYDYKYTNYTGEKNKIIVTCPIHGNFEINPANHLHSLNGCKKCNSSRGELITMTILDSLNIRYKTQVAFDGCNYKRSLYFDFQIFRNNSEFFLLEIDGEQHKNPIRLNGISDKKAVEIYKDLKIRDEIKNNWASENLVLLHRIDYIDNKFNKLKQDVRNLLNKEFPQTQLTA